MNLVELVLRWSRDTPHAPAILAGKQILRFAEFDQQSAQVAGMLRRSGLKPGDVVLVFVPMGIDLYLLLTGLWRVGLVAMVVDPSAGADLLQRSVERVTPAGFVGTTRAQVLRLRHACLRRIPCSWSIGIPLACRRWNAWRSCRADFSITEVADDQPALITFTSGSTGLPKGVVRSHGFLRAQHTAVAKCLDHRPGAIDLATLPIFALANLASGQCVLIPDGDLRRPGAIAAQPVLHQLARHRPRSVVASPAFLERLAAAATTLAPLAVIHTGGGPVFPALLERVQRLAPDARVVALYGSTEAEPIAWIAYRDMSDADLLAQRSGRGLLAGSPVAGLELAIMPDQWGTPWPACSNTSWQARRLPTGSAGEIVVSGAHVLPGYLGGVGDDETKCTVDGQVWHRTGDAGWLDDQGRLWLLGRCSARLSDRFGVLYPFAIEAAAQAHPGVSRAALTSLGEERVLVIEGPTSLESLRESLAWAHLAQVIRHPIPLDRRHDAKINYPELLRRLRISHAP